MKKDNLIESLQLSLFDDFIGELKKDGVSDDTPSFLFIIAASRADASAPPESPSV